jgi:hypothetical protein
VAICKAVWEDALKSVGKRILAGVNREAGTWGMILSLPAHDEDRILILVYANTGKLCSIDHAAR